MRMILANVNFQVSPAKPGFGDASCNAPFLLAKRFAVDFAAFLLVAITNKL